MKGLLEEEDLQNRCWFVSRHADAWVRVIGSHIDSSASEKPITVCTYFKWASWWNYGLFTISKEIIGAEKTKVDIVRDGKKRSLMIVRKIQGEIELIDGKEADQPVVISNTKYWMVQI